MFPADVNARANKILDGIKHSIGCYSDSQGIVSVRQSVAKYIQNRDGYPSSADDIFLSNGASSAIKVFLVRFYLGFYSQCLNMNGRVTCVQSLQGKFSMQRKNESTAGRSRGEKRQLSLKRF